MAKKTCESCGHEVDTDLDVCPNCATGIRTATATAVTEDSLDTEAASPEIPGYRIIGRLGEGGMGAVYLAEEIALGRRVAIKVISARIASNAESRARFLREARTLATIEHPHVVRVYSFGEIEGGPYLVMEYVEGESLAERLTRRGKLPVDEAIRIARDVVDALDAAWERKVIHRDIKPSNILIDRRDRVRVADFGLAKAAKLVSDATITQAGFMVGSPHYVSPEQAEGSDVDFRSDFYSLGIMLFHMISGQRPFDGVSPIAIMARHLHDPRPSLGDRGADVPQQVERLTRSLMERVPAQRPSSHAQLLATLDSMIVRTPSTPIAITENIAISPSKHAGPLITAIVAAVLILTAMGIFIVRSRDKPPPVAATPHAEQFVVAVAPFYGPEEESAREGRVMAALVERAIAQKLGTEGARVLGIEETKSPIRTHDEARGLAARLHADAVIWGEAFVLRRETEIQPHVTVVSAPRDLSAASETTAPAVTSEKALSSNDFETTESFKDVGGVLKLQAEAPNQIELRKTSASGIGDVVLILAAIHALTNEHAPKKALPLLRQAPRTAETLRYQVQALLQLDRKEEAQSTLEEALALDPDDAPSRALLGDLNLTAGRLPEAVAAYERAAALGKPYTSSRGIFYDGKLYSKETYIGQGNRGLVETLYLLAIDPASHRVVERYLLPGVATSFRPDGKALVITCNIGRRETRLIDVPFEHGHLAQASWPSPSLLARMNSMRAGRVVATNFLDELARIREPGDPGGQFVLAKFPDKELPATLPDLERALRAAIDRDATQPWHLFFLALTLRQQKRLSEADEAIALMTARDYPGVPYYDFAWMLSLLERLGERRWNDALYAKAMAQRLRIPQPPIFATLIERLINASFARQAAVNRNGDAGHEALVHAREITGLVPEGDELAAAAWAESFESRGRKELARREREIVRLLRESPLNYLAATAMIDDALAATTAAAAAFLLLLLFVAGAAIGRARRLPRTLRESSPGRETGPRRIGGTALTALLAGIVLMAITYRLTMGLTATGDTADTGYTQQFLDAIITVALIGLLFHLFRVSLGAVVICVTRRERLALLFAWVLFVAAAVFAWDRLAARSAIERLPIGFSDAVGHPLMVQEIEELLQRRTNDVAVRYAAAVMNHYAGNQRRAGELYAALGDNSADVVANRKALGDGRPPVAPLTVDQVADAWMESWLDRWRAMEASSMAPLKNALPVLAGGFLILLPLLFARLGTAAGDIPLSRFERIGMLSVPGYYDVRRNFTWRAWVTLLLAAVATALAFMTFTRFDRGPLVGAFPLPTTGADPLDGIRLTVLTAYPYATVNLILIALALLGASVLHAARIPRILSDRPSSLVTPASEAETVIA